MRSLLDTFGYIYNIYDDYIETEDKSIRVGCIIINTGIWFYNKFAYRNHL